MDLLANKSEIPFLPRVKTKLNMMNNPQPVAKKEKELPSKKMAEREFLNHKGPLIDMYGPGSVFYMIRVREKTKVKGFDSRDKRKISIPIISPTKMNTYMQSRSPRLLC